jgi:hypothetical protein
MNVYYNFWGAICKRSRCVLFRAHCQLAEEVVGLLAAEPCRCRVLTGIQKAHRATPEQDLAVKMQIAKPHGPHSDRL